jgi:hypothetical protein
MIACFAAQIAAQGQCRCHLMTIVRSGSNFHLRKRVSLRHPRVGPRVTVWISLQTGTETVAKQKTLLAWQHHKEAWEARMAGDVGDAERRCESACELAAVRGYRDLPAGQVATLPREELLARVEAIPVRNHKPDKVEAVAIHGGASEPPIMVSRALELFWTLTGDQVIGKSEDQVWRWKNPCKKAVANFIGVVGDKVLGDISGDDMLDFRQWWTEKLESEDLTPNSANKDLIHLEGGPEDHQQA